MSTSSVFYSDGFSTYDDQLPTLLARAVVWLVVVVACLVAVRRPWAWFGLAGGLVGLAVAVTYAVDGLRARSDLDAERQLGAHVFDTEANGGLGPVHDAPGFVDEPSRLSDVLTLADTVALALVAAALVVGAMLSRRRDSRAVH